MGGKKYEILETKGINTVNSRAALLLKILIWEHSDLIHLICSPASASRCRHGPMYTRSIQVHGVGVVGRVQELCESRGGRPGLSVLTSLTVSVDVKQH